MRNAKWHAANSTGCLLDPVSAVMEWMPIGELFSIANHSNRCPRHKPQLRLGRFPEFDNPTRRHLAITLSYDHTRNVCALKCACNVFAAPLAEIGCAIGVSLQVAQLPGHLVRTSDSRSGSGYEGFGWRRILARAGLNREA